ncbi:MAG: hypothetical protein ACR2FI_09900 [Burkholderiales bacterium]|nr:hypothetical protein [Burkholderiales bacterium]MDQ3197156.1 hypothetical protein [Pseudomonadota bacterium]
MPKSSVVNQLKAHSVAIISLVVALSGLAYNSWRDAVVEENHSIRIAAFEVLKNLGELQLIADYAHYQKDRALGNPITGWGRVALIRDLSRVIPAPAPKAADRLLQIWQENWELLEDDAAAAGRVNAQIAETREAVMLALQRLR